MNQITLVTGGARSGKSSYAEKIVAEYPRVLYVATAIPFDEEMKARVALHRGRRPAHWGTVEAYKDIEYNLERVKETFDVILLDCLTVMTTNLMFDNPNFDCDLATEMEKLALQNQICQQVSNLLAWVRQNRKAAVLVTNEVGMGIVPENRLARYFRDVAGMVNQQAAAEADAVWLVSCGIPLQLK